MKSIIQDERKCFICGKPHGLQLHHLMQGRNRQNADKYGLTVWLCQEHHTGNSGVHCNKDLADEFHKLAEKEFILRHSYKEWMEIFGKNYLEEIC